MKYTRYILFLFFAIGVLLTTKVRADLNEDNRRKADYIFMEAATARAEGRNDDRLMLLRRAAALQPDDPFITGALAEDVINNMALRDQALYAELSGAIIDRYFAEPSILANGQRAIQIARMLNDHALEVKIYEALHENLPKNQDVTLGLADAYLTDWIMDRTDTVSYTKGMDILERLVAAAPDNLMYTARILRPLMLQADTAAVEEKLKNVREAAPADVNVAIFSAQVYSMLDRDSLVELSFERGRQIDDQNGQLLMAMADYYKQKNDSAAYERQVFAALSAQDLDFEAKLPLLRDYVSTLYEDSLLQSRIDNLFEMVQQTNPGEAEFHNLYGQYLVVTGRNSDAIDQYNVALGLNPNNQAVHTELTRLYLLTENYPKAVEAGRKSIEMFPDNLFAGIFTSIALVELDSVQAAIDLLEDFNPENLNEYGKGQLYSRLGDMYSLAKQNDKSFDAYEKAIIYDPENYMAMNNLAYFYAEADTLLSRAEMYITLAVGNEPDLPTYLDTFAWVLYKQNRYKEAAEQIDAALKYCFMTDDVRKILGDYAHEESEDIKIDESHKVSPEILEHAGDIYFMLREPKKSRTYWQAALSIADEPDDKQRLEDKISGKFYFDEK